MRCPPPGYPTRVWDSKIAVFDESFGVNGDQFQFGISVAHSGQIQTANQPTYVGVAIEVAESLSEPRWQWHDTAILDYDSSLGRYVIDPDWANHPGRFYRLRMP